MSNDKTGVDPRKLRLAKRAWAATNERIKAETPEIGRAMIEATRKAVRRLHRTGRISKIHLKPVPFLLLAGSMAGLLGGCGIPDESYTDIGWSSAEARLNRDRNHCAYTASDFGAWHVQPERFRRCMAGNGWATNQ